MNRLHQQIIAATHIGRAYAVATILDGPHVGVKAYWDDARSHLTTAPDAALAGALLELAEVQLAKRHSTRTELSLGENSYSVFVDVQLPPEQLIIVGAVHIAISLVTFARTLGFRTIVLDARSAFAGGGRFAHADRLILGWPADYLQEVGLTASTYVVALSHDEKIDNPVLAACVRSPVRYIGALGSRKTHARRAEQLQELGLTAAEIARIHAPIGLNIGAAMPEEIALAIMAQIVTIRRQAHHASM
jgi:xanthine dehydrogenase accessory factor